MSVVRAVGGAEVWELVSYACLHDGARGVGRNPHWALGLGQVQNHITGGGTQRTRDPENEGGWNEGEREGEFQLSNKGFGFPHCLAELLRVQGSPPISSTVSKRVCGVISSSSLERSKASSLITRSN